MTAAQTGAATAASLSSGQNAAQALTDIRQGLIGSLENAGVVSADVAALAEAVMSGLTAGMAQGASPAAAQEYIQQALASVAAQVLAVSTGMASQPTTVLASGLAQGEAAVAQAVEQVLGGASAEGRAAAGMAIQATLAEGADIKVALAQAAQALANAQQQVTAAAVPLNADAQSMANLSGDGAGIQAAIATVTADLNPAQSAIFAGTLSTLLAQGVPATQALAMARVGAAAAADQAALAAVAVSRADALVAALNNGISFSKVLEALGIAGGESSPAGQAALGALTLSLARGDTSAVAFAAAGEAAAAATLLTQMAAVSTKETAAQALASAADPVAALNALIGSMDSAAPETAAFLTTISRSLAEGRTVVEAYAVAQEAAQSAAQQLATNIVSSPSHSRLIQALAVGQNVSVVVAEELAAVAEPIGTEPGRQVDTTLLLRTLLQPLSQGQDQAMAVSGVTAQMLAAKRHIEKSSDGVATPDPELMALASGSSLPPVAFVDTTPGKGTKAPVALAQ